MPPSVRSPVIAIALVAGMGLPAQGIPRVSYSVFFDAQSAEIKPTTINTNALTAFVWHLKRYHPRCVVVSIDAHADSTEAATDIAARRAYAVYVALLDRGMNEEGFSVKVAGAREPLVPTAPGAAEARNRRVVLNWAWVKQSGMTCYLKESGCEYILADGTNCNY